jgi:cytochrome c-type protein NapC
MENPTTRQGLFARIGARIRAAGPLFVGGTFVAGILAWGAFNWSFELTNTESFCISCHEMQENVFKEYRNTIHYQNRTGVRATCPDCHVPKEWVHKVVRKIQASNELLHKVLGTIDTREKFEANRLEMAKRVWASMKATDSRECRNCHSLVSMDLDVQDRIAKKRHKEALEATDPKTCIDCHEGIAHHLPEGY